jgi:hypothetical protein
MEYIAVNIPNGSTRQRESLPKALPDSVELIRDFLVTLTEITGTTHVRMFSSVRK